MGQTDRRTDGRPTVAYTPHTMRVVEMDPSHEYLTDLSTSPVRCSHFTLENSLKTHFSTDSQSDGAVCVNIGRFWGHGVHGQTYNC